MKVTINDPELVAILERATEKFEVTDPTGRILGTFTLEGTGRLPAGYQIPFTDAEIEERRKVRTGSPIKDILHDLREKYGS